MTRINFFLLVVLVLSCLYTVHVAYDARRLYTQLDRSQNESRQFESDYQRLRAEKQAQATPLRVEKTAREKLGMRTATPAVTQYVTYQRSALIPLLPQASAAATGTAPRSLSDLGRLSEDGPQRGQFSADLQAHSCAYGSKNGGGLDRCGTFAADAPQVRQAPRSRGTP
jgi:cell division protein FtsL